MKNKIEFIRFNKSHENHSEILESYKKKNNLLEKVNKLASLKSEIENAKSDIDYKLITVKEKTILESIYIEFNNIVEQECDLFRIGNDQSIVPILKDLTRFLKFSSSKKKDEYKLALEERGLGLKNYEVINKIYDQLSEKYDLNDVLNNIIDLKKREEQLNRVEFLENSIIDLDKEIKYHQNECKNLKNRISENELESLNLKVAQMNKEGWSLKQIEGIQSGSKDYFFDSDGCYGYGYSYTEGIMVIWEK